MPAKAPTEKQLEALAFLAGLKHPRVHWGKSCVATDDGTRWKPYLCAHIRALRANGLIELAGGAAIGMSQPTGASISITDIGHAYLREICK